MEIKTPHQTMFDKWRNNHVLFKQDYSQGNTSFIAGLMPEIAVKLSIYEVFQVIADRFGNESFSNALNPDNTVLSPVAYLDNATWLKKSNMVGVNVRTIGNFFNLVKYGLTLGQNIDSIHILPVWEPGVVSSLYGKTSWNINSEFLSYELKSLVPHLDTPEKQLKVTINLLHLMGKTVGMDVIPHTDRFSEMVFLYPVLFEWIYREGPQLVNVDNNNYLSIQDLVWQYFHENNANYPVDLTKEAFFDPSCQIYSDQQKSVWLFGEIKQPQIRLKRRLELMQILLNNGFETYPVTMAPPYRGIHIKDNDFIIDELGIKWYNYHFDNPQGMSRVFGPLTRYKFFNTFSGTQTLDFNNPNVLAWDYIARKYFENHFQYNFDFMRGDMAHVQPRENGVPQTLPDYYDPLFHIKNYINEKGAKHFGFFAETFLAPDNTMGYGNEADHLEAIGAESTLGDLQASKVGSELFMSNLQNYLHYLENRKFAPNFTVMTADKDDPRFDEFFEKGNLLRYFVATFLVNMPSYVSLGFESRNPHLTRVPNEEYSKLYVFQIIDEKEKDKVTHGPYIFGKNETIFAEIEKLKLIFESLSASFNNQVVWHKKPELNQKLGIWETGKHIFISNFSESEDIDFSQIEKLSKNLELVYSSFEYEKVHECRIYKIV